VLFNSTNPNTVFGFPSNGRLHASYVRYIKSLCHQHNRARSYCGQGTAKLYVAKHSGAFPAILGCVWGWQ